MPAEQTMITLLPTTLPYGDLSYCAIAILLYLDHEHCCRVAAYTCAAELKPDTRRQCPYKVTNFNSASIVSSRKTALILRRPGI